MRTNGDSASSRLPRDAGLDVLRGIAVVLMLQQHLIAWLWDAPWGNVRKLFDDHPVILSVNALGGGAAPLFVLLAGAGTAFLANRFSGRDLDKVLFARGSVLLLLGFLLSLAVPRWFSPGSWYILHLIGSGFLLTPLFRHMSTVVILALSGLVVAATPIMQWLLATPQVLSNARMGDTSLSGGFFRLAAVEGHFPLLPWMGLFMIGIASGRWIIARKSHRLFWAGGCCAFLGMFFYAAGNPITAIKTPNTLASYSFALTSRIYPCFPPLFLLLSALTLAATGLAIVVLRNSAGPIARFFMILGRSSLTILIVHVILFKQMSHLTGTYKVLPAAMASAITIGIILLFALGSFCWQRWQFRYGAEWLIRQPEKLIL